MPKGEPKKRYAPEFKPLVVETMLNERLSYSENGASVLNISITTTTVASRES
ncbi:MAG: hypothetical protein U0M15_00690 [Bacillota bacterium]|nr:hypothetical protein [Bacillota bacterium]